MPSLVLASASTAATISSLCLALYMSRGAYAFWGKRSWPRSVSAPSLKMLRLSCSGDKASTEVEVAEVDAAEHRVARTVGPRRVATRWAGSDPGLARAGRQTDMDGRVVDVSSSAMSIENWWPSLLGFFGNRPLLWPDRKSSALLWWQGFPGVPSRHNRGKSRREAP